MTLALTEPPTAGAQQRGSWIPLASPFRGALVTVDGHERLRTGARVHHRSDVDTRRGTVTVRADGHELLFACSAHADDATPSQPGPLFGWSAALPGSGFATPVRCGQVYTACLHDADAALALQAITVGAIAQARERAQRLREHRPAGKSGRSNREAADRWERAARTLKEGTVAAEQIRRVPRRLLCDAFLRAVGRGEITPSLLARRVGWFWTGRDGKRTADSGRVLRRLGLVPDSGSDGPSARWLAAGPQERALLDVIDEVCATVSYDTGVAICRGLRRDPAEFGWL